MSYYNPNPYEQETAEDRHDRNRANVAINDHISRDIREWLKATEPQPKPSPRAVKRTARRMMAKAIAKQESEPQNSEYWQTIERAARKMWQGVNDGTPDMFGL